MVIIRDPMPLPSKDGKILKKIIKITKTIIDLLCNKSAKEGGKAPQANDQSSVDDIDHIMRVFDAFKEQVHTQAEKIEQEMQTEISYYLEELNQMLLDNNDVLEKYGIRTARIQKNIDKILDSVVGSIDSEISKSVSLSNTECRNIMKMIPGEKKERAFQTFLEHAMANALEVYCKNLRSAIADIFDEVGVEVSETIEKLQKTAQYQMNQMEQIEENNCEEIVVNVIGKANYIIEQCDLTNSLL